MSTPKRDYASYHEAVADQTVRVEFAYSEAAALAKLLNTYRDANGVYTFGRFAQRFTRALERAEASARKAVRP